MERWKEIPETNGKIFISDYGRVMSVLSGNPRILKCYADPKGYLKVSITISQVKRTLKVHREVAKAFIPNPDNLPQVNHIDGNKNNNCVENLEWCTNQQNAIHAIRTGLWDSVLEGAMKENERRKRPIIAKKGDIVLRFQSISEAERMVGTKHINDVIKGKRTHAKGWTFAYESEVMPCQR